MKTLNLVKTLISVFSLMLFLTAPYAFAEDPLVEALRGREGTMFWETLINWILGLAIGIAIIVLFFGLIKYITATGNFPIKEASLKLIKMSGIAIVSCLIIFVIMRLMIQYALPAV